MARYSILSVSSSLTPDGQVDCRVRYDSPQKYIGQSFRTTLPKGVTGLSAMEAKEIIRYWGVLTAESVCAAIDANERKQAELKLK